MPKVKSEPDHKPDISPSYSPAKSPHKPHQTNTQTPTASSWTQLDKSRLYDYVLLNKPGEWERAAEHVPGKSAKQCRDHWMKTLGPYIKKTCDLV